MIDRENTHGPEIPQHVPGPVDRLLDDCWFIEVMPPTWAWGYRRLMELGSADQRRFTNRIA